MIKHLPCTNLSVIDIYNQINFDINERKLHHGFVRFTINNDEYTFGWQIKLRKVKPSVLFYPDKFNLSEWGNVPEKYAGEFWYKNRAYAYSYMKTLPLLTIPYYGNGWIDTCQIYSGIIAALCYVTDVNIPSTFDPYYIGYKYAQDEHGEFTISQAKSIVPKYSILLQKIDKEIRNETINNIYDWIINIPFKKINNIDCFITEYKINIPKNQLCNVIVLMAIGYVYKFMNINECKPISGDICKIIADSITKCINDKEVTYYQFDVITKVFHELKKALKNNESESNDATSKTSK